MLNGNNNSNPKVEGQLRVALLGAGKVAEAHALALKSIPGVSVAAICDTDGSKAEVFAGRWQIPAWFDDPARMLRTERIDTLHVLTPPPAHAACAIEAMAAGCHVLIEKPMAITVAQVDEIRRAARRNRRVVAVNHTAIHVSTYLRLLDVIRSRRLGAVEEVIASSNSPLALQAKGLWMLREPGNIILELGAHTLSALLRIMGPMQSASVTVTNKVLLADGTPFYKTWLVNLLCERGPVQMHMSFGRDFGDATVMLIGQDGVATADLRRDTVRVTGNSRFLAPVDNLLDSFTSARTIAGDALRSFHEFTMGLMGIRPLSDNYNRIMRASIGDFYNALRQGRPPVSGLEQGAAVVEACEAIIRSSGVQNIESGAQRDEKVYVG